MDFAKGKKSFQFKRLKSFIQFAKTDSIKMAVSFNDRLVVLVHNFCYIVLSRNKNTSFHIRFHHNCQYVCVCWLSLLNVRCTSKRTSLHSMIVLFYRLPIKRVKTKPSAKTYHNSSLPFILLHVGVSCQVVFVCIFNFSFCIIY